MKKLFFLLLVIFSTSAFAQKVEHGVLVGGGIGFPMQDSKQATYSAYQRITLRP